MTYFEKFEREILLDLDDATKLAVQVVMKEGELRFRESLISALSQEMADHTSNQNDDSILGWLDGVNYVIHLLKEADFSDE